MKRKVEFEITFQFEVNANDELEFLEESKEKIHEIKFPEKFSISDRRFISSYSELKPNFWTEDNDKEVEELNAYIDTN